MVLRQFTPPHYSIYHTLIRLSLGGFFYPFAVKFSSAFLLLSFDFFLLCVYPLANYIYHALYRFSSVVPYLGFSLHFSIMLFLEAVLTATVHLHRRSFLLLFFFPSLLNTRLYPTRSWPRFLHLKETVLYIAPIPYITVEIHICFL